MGISGIAGVVTTGSASILIVYVTEFPDRPNLSTGVTVNVYVPATMPAVGVQVITFPIFPGLDSTQPRPEGKALWINVTESSFGSVAASGGKLID